MNSPWLSDIWKEKEGGLLLYNVLSTKFVELLKSSLTLNDYRTDLLMGFL